MEFWTLIATLSPAWLLSIGMVLGAAAWELAGAIAPPIARKIYEILDREPRCIGMVRCGLGFHDYDFLQDLGCVVCWRCAKLAPPHIDRRINERNARLAGAG